MQRVLAIVLLGVGAFGVVLAILLPTFVVSASKKTPLNLNITTVATGPATLLDASTGTASQIQVQSTRVVRTDSKASNSDVTVVEESLCTMVVAGKTPGCVGGNDPRRLSLSTDRVAADRRTGEAVNASKYGTKIDGQPADHSGLSYKFPIDTKKKTYQFFLPDLKAAFPAEYTGTSTIEGLPVYTFRCDTGTQDYQIGGVLPGSLNDVRTVSVEPRTGVIVKGVEQQTQTLASGQTALEATLTFDAATIKAQANYAKDSIDQLRLAGIWAPLVSGLLGIALIAVGVFLLRSRPSSPPMGGTHSADTTTPDPVRV